MKLLFGCKTRCCTQRAGRLHACSITPLSEMALYDISAKRLEESAEAFLKHQLTSMKVGENPGVSRNGALVDAFGCLRG